MAKQEQLQGRAAQTGARIVLDQDNPVAGDVVTFTVEAKGATEIDLVCGDANQVNHWPPGTGISTRLPVGSEFTLPEIAGTRDDGYTAVAWLMKKGDPVMGVLFWVTSN